MINTITGMMIGHWKYDQLYYDDNDYDYDFANDFANDDCLFCLVHDVWSNDIIIIINIMNIIMIILFPDWIPLLFSDWIPLLDPVHGVRSNNLPSIRPLWIRLQVHAKTHLLPAGNHHFFHHDDDNDDDDDDISNLGTAKLARIVKLSNQFLPFDQFSSFGLIIIILT